MVRIFGDESGCPRVGRRARREVVGVAVGGDERRTGLGLGLGRARAEAAEATAVPVAPDIASDVTRAIVKVVVLRT